MFAPMFEPERTRETERVCGIILAAGAATRFGGGKLLALVDGRPMLERVVSAATSCERVTETVVVLGAEREAIFSRVRLDGARVAYCEDWEQGMSASLRSGVAAARNADVAVILLGDQPFVTSAVIERVMDHLGARTCAARAYYRGIPSHPVAVRRELFAPLSVVTGDQGGRDVPAIAAAAEVDCSDLGSGRDIDTADDLRRAAEDPP